MVWLWGSRAGSATTSTAVDKAMIPSIGPTRSVDRAKSGATDRLYRDTACAAATAFGSHRFQARAADGLRKQARLPGGRTPKRRVAGSRSFSPEK